MLLRLRSDRPLFYALCALLFWVPIPIGSNRPWSAALLCGIVFLLLALWSISQLTQRTPLPRSFRYAWPALGLLIITQLWVLSTLHLPQSGGGSFDPSRTYQQLLLGTALTALFALTLLLVRSKRRIRILIYTLIISGISQAVYGSLMTLSGIEYNLFLPKEHYKGTVTGTFVNRNHMAGYMELCLAVGIGFMIATLKNDAASSWRDFGRRVLEALLGTKARVRIGLVIMVAALVMTHSRMGNTAFFASMTIAGVIALILSKRAPRATVILLTSLIIIDLVVVGTFFGVEKVINRIENTTLGTIKRDEVNEFALPLLQDNLITGTGAGSFYGVFPEYRQEEIGTLYFDHTHNDYLQFAIEFGLIGFIPLLLMLALTFIVALRAQWLRKDALMRGLSFSALMAIIAFGIHSSVDFNLQIPANAATFMVILALGWISMYFKDPKRT